MLTHPTLEKLHTLKLTGMARAFTQGLRFEDLASASDDAGEHVLFPDCKKSTKISPPGRA